MTTSYRNATSVSIAGFAVLLEGDPKSGKSSLALHLTENGGKLISDDLTFIKKEEDSLYALPAEKMSGYLHIRELGLLKIDKVETKKKRIGAIIKLVDEVNIEQKQIDILDVQIPVFQFKKYDFALTNKINAVIKILKNKWELTKI